MRVSGGVPSEVLWRGSWRVCSRVEEVWRVEDRLAASGGTGERALKVLAEIRLTDQAAAPASALSYGQKKLLELGMALMAEPKLLLLDEPVAGVNPARIDELKEELQRMPGRGITLFIVEHNLKLVFDICDWIFVLDRGRVLTAGTPEQVSKDERVIEAYLGRG